VRVRPRRFLNRHIEMFRAGHFAFFSLNFHFSFPLLLLSLPHARNRPRA
jgi:hypothetical protein